MTQEELKEKLDKLSDDDIKYQSSFFLFRDLLFVNNSKRINSVRVGLDDRIMKDTFLGIDLLRFSKYKKDASVILGLKTLKRVVINENGKIQVADNTK